MNPQQLVQDIEHLFSLPDVAIRINELIDRPDTTTKELVEAVQLDAGIATTVLRLANSAWYGLPSRVDTISRAITLIGMKALQDLVRHCDHHLQGHLLRVRGHDGLLGQQRDLRRGHPQPGQEMRRARSSACRGPAAQGGAPAFDASRPLQYRQVLQEKDSGEAAIIEAELAAFGFTYAELGAALMRAWRLPEALDELIAYQLHAADAPGYPRETAILHVAGDIAFHMSPDISGRFQLGEYNLTFDEAVWILLGLERGELTEIMQTSLIQSFELLEIVNPRAYA